MAQQIVFSDNLNPATGSLTQRFTNAVAFHIDAPLITAELEIDVFLQVYFPTVTGEKLRNLKLGSLKDGQITLNETDTETVVVIPEEFLDSGLEMALFFLASESIYLEVFVEKKTITDQALNEKLDLINVRLDEIAASQTNLNLTDLIDTLTPIDLSELQQFILDLGFL